MMLATPTPQDEVDNLFMVSTTNRLDFVCVRLRKTSGGFTKITQYSGSSYLAFEVIPDAPRDADGCCLQEMDI